MNTIFGLSAALSVLLAGTNFESKWREDGTVWISATVAFDDVALGFSVGEKALDEAAAEVCGDKGQPRQVEEATLNAVSIAPDGKRKATFSAVYACG
jgi:hypothetical protein